MCQHVSDGLRQQLEHEAEVHNLGHWPAKMQYDALHCTLHHLAAGLSEDLQRLFALIGCCPHASMAMAQYYLSFCQFCVVWHDREGVQDVNEFAWQMQLRYSWNEAVDDVVVRQVNSRSGQLHLLSTSRQTNATSLAH